jgi:uncharacterized protein (TIGR03435 family)
MAAAAQVTEPRFEVASVKPNQSGDVAIRVDTSGGRFTATNVPLMLLIRLAYAIPEFRIANAPDWVRADRFDVSATIGEAASRERQNAMLRTLLRERFRLVVRMEVREQPILILVRSRPEASLLPTLKRSPTDCAALTAAARSGTPQPPANRILCGVQRRPGGVSVGGMTMAQIAAELLTPEAGRLVLDHTGLDGAFDFDLDFVPAAAQGVAASDAVTLTTALQEQLGLRLQPQRGPVEVLVIDSVEQPTPN